MTYLPFARKWRPQDFDEVVGQSHITTTLKNAILLNRVHHAYLFTGPRGIGKTSTARIFSKALNCEKGPTPKPCNKCSSCQEINTSSSIDVMEIDGASNRGIDEIRNLRESVKFAPSKGQYKIYIIDEVHMLTTEAFNALLKTLEEPPKHVKFIFATTEPHKMLPTILSRCQRFDFRRISLKDIILKLQEVAKEEKLDIENDVFLYIAKASDGSMRDAESILDQVTSFSKGKVYLKDVIESLGMIEEDTLFRASDLIVKKDTKSALHLVDELFNSGKDAKQFLNELLEHFRNIMVAKATSSPEELIDLPKESVERIKKLSQSLSKGDIFYIISVITNSLRMIKQLLPERVVLELCMIKLTSRDSITSIEEILSKLPEISKASHESPIRDTVTPKPAVTQHHSFVQKIQESVKHVIRHDKPAPIIDISKVKDAWPILVKTMAVKKMSISSYLSEGEPESIKGNIVFVGFPKEFNFHREVLEEKRNKLPVEQALSQILDAKIGLEFIVTDRKIEKIILKPQPDKITKEELKKKEPIIDAALNIFDGKLLRTQGT